MITEYVLFGLPAGMTRDEVVQGMRDVAPAWRQRVRNRYGSEPVIRHFDTPLVVDNALRQTTEFPL